MEGATIWSCTAHSYVHLVSEISVSRARDKPVLLIGPNLAMAIPTVVLPNKAFQNRGNIVCHTPDYLVGPHAHCPSVLMSPATPTLMATKAATSSGATPLPRMHSKEGTSSTEGFYSTFLALGLASGNTNEVAYTKVVVVGGNTVRVGDH